MEENIFYIDEKKLDIEISLASMHFWLQEDINFELLRLTVLDANGKDSNLGRFLNNKNTTALDTIRVIKELVNNGNMMIFMGIKMLMLVSDEMKNEMIQKLKERIDEKEN